MRFSGNLHSLLLLITGVFLVSVSQQVISHYHKNESPARAAAQVNLTGLTDHRWVAVAHQQEHRMGLCITHQDTHCIVFWFNAFL